MTPRPKSASAGIIGMFDSADALVAAVRDARDRGRRLRAYSPFPIEALPDLLGLRPSPVRWWVLGGALAGGLLGYCLQWYSAVVDYAFLAGNRPPYSWPAFIPVTFELLVLGGAIAGFLAVLGYSGLPRLHHPVFDIEGFELESRSRFFLLIITDRTAQDARLAQRILRDSGASDIQEVGK